MIGYRPTVAELTGLPLDDAELTPDVREYRNGDWLSPHVDKPEKLVTQIFYFTQRWMPGDGGRLSDPVLFRPGGPGAPLAPSIGCSALLVRSETSWHAIEAPAPGAPHRRSVTATFWTKKAVPALA